MALNIFEGIPDRFNGITVDSSDEPCNVEQFQVILSESLNGWIENGKRCIWFKVNIKDAAWVPLLANNGFNFHHARDDFVMMYKWLPTDVPNLPPASHTNLGVGGMVFNNKNEVLVVTEQHYEYPHWKLPGGYVERGEDIKNAAIREVREETGIETTFESLVTIRHTHKMMFGNSDIYVVVLLRATSDKIIKSETEIKECKWMKIEEFLEHPHVHEFNRFLIRQAMDCKRRKLKINLKEETINIAKFSRDVTAMILEDL